jgi:hypothetical protein
VGSFSCLAQIGDAIFARRYSTPWPVSLLMVIALVVIRLILGGVCVASGDRVTIAREAPEGGVRERPSEQALSWRSTCRSRGQVIGPQ